MQVFGILQQCNWSLYFSGMSLCDLVPDISRRHGDFIFKVWNVQWETTTLYRSIGNQSSSETGDISQKREISTMLEIYVHIAVFWAVGQCSLVGGHHVKEQHTAFIFSPRKWGKMLFQIACIYCQITWCYKPENHKVNLCRHENFPCQKLVKYGSTCCMKTEKEGAFPLVQKLKTAVVNYVTNSIMLFWVNFHYTEK